MKTLSVRQPYASLLAAGVKDIENRSWSTKHRGWMLIHASGDKPLDLTDIDDPRLPILCELNKEYSFTEHEMKGPTKYYKCGEAEQLLYVRDFAESEKREENFICSYPDGLLPVHAIVGAVFLEEVVESSVSPWADPGSVHWVISKAVLFSRPEEYIRGKLRLWNYPFEKLSKENQSWEKQAAAGSPAKENGDTAKGSPNSNQPKGDN